MRDVILGEILTNFGWNLGTDKSAMLVRISMHVIKILRKVVDTRSVTQFKLLLSM